MVRYLFWLVLLLCLSESSIEASSKILFRSPKQTVRLLEVYSSEGCKDCLSAEAWLSQLQKRPGLWKEFIPVLFPVTLWDRLGWKDSFGFRAADERLKIYHSRTASPAITLPSVWYAGQEILDLNQPLPTLAAMEQPGVLEIKGLGNEEFLLVFKPEVPLQLDRLQFHGAQLRFGVSTKILFGENAGQTVMRDFLITNYRSKLGKCDTKSCSTSLRFPDKQGMNDPVSPSLKAVVFWVSGTDEPSPIQSAGGYL